MRDRWLWYMGVVVLLLGTGLSGYIVFEAVTGPSLFTAVFCPVVLGVAVGFPWVFFVLPLLRAIHRQRPYYAAVCNVVQALPPRKLWAFTPPDDSLTYIVAHRPFGTSFLHRMEPDDRDRVLALQSGTSSQEILSARWLTLHDNAPVIYRHSEVRPVVTTSTGDFVTDPELEQEPVGWWTRVRSWLWEMRTGHGFADASDLEEILATAYAACTQEGGQSRPLR